MKLADIIKGTGATILRGTPDTEVLGIASDSRKVEKGWLFIAVKGCAVDGHAFVDQAVEKGAVAVVDADRKALALCADRFYGHPSG